ncbi:MAG: hypothetical protein V1720_03740 [bacterium]
MSRYDHTTGALRKRQQRAIKKEICLSCESRENLQLHHPDIKNRPDEFEILCADCHRDLHIFFHSWGKMNKKYRK